MSERQCRHCGAKSSDAVFIRDSYQDNGLICEGCWSKKKRGEIPGYYQAPDVIINVVAHWLDSWRKAILRYLMADRRRKEIAYEAALTRILKWARDYFHSPDEELLAILSDAGFKIDHDGVMVVRGERVEQ